MDTTFLCWRWAKPEDAFLSIKRKFDFLRESNAVKVAFPQDEYDHSKVLDDWLYDWKIDVVYSVCFEDRAVFYPRVSHSAEIRKGYTGLFEPADIALVARSARPWREREIDVGYRARRLPPYFGRFGALKADIADRFVSASSKSGLQLDISCDPEKTIAGDAWLEFLGNCRFTLGCESGSSILDPVGQVRECCDAFQNLYPEASFEEVEAACFKGLDREKPFNAISPRLFESAAAGCAQILVPGSYDGLLEPWIHYLPLEPDAANAAQILEAMQDVPAIETMIAASQERLLGAREYSYAGYAENVMSAVRAHRPDTKFNLASASSDDWLRLLLQSNERWAEAWPRWWLAN
ncbi:MAG: hypothetical protein Q8922_14520 [Bacteroidota bacterium]|nr:hypothetical protein [Bacteroidota bacterium]